MIVHLKNFLFVFTLITLISCGEYQKDLPSLNNGNIDTGITPIQDDDDLTPPPEDLKLSLEDLLDIYFARVVVPRENSEHLDTLVNYDGIHELRVNKEQNFLTLVSAIKAKFADPNLTQGMSLDQKVATYINAYNFFIIDLVNRNYIKGGKKIDSVLDLGSRFKLGFDIFEAKFINIAGERLSLDNVEKDKVLKEFTQNEDARIHFAVICASNGCPLILNEAYRGESLNQQLDFVTKSGLKLDRMFKNEGSTTRVSKIFEWYEDDFNKDSGNIKAFLEKHVPTGTTLYGSSNDDFKKMDYDWDLNKTNDRPVIIPEFPTLGDSTDVPPVDNGLSKEPCKEFEQNQAFEVKASCLGVISAEESSSQYSISDASVCLVKSDSKNKFTLKGQILAIDSSQEESIRDISFEFKGKEKDGEISYDSFFKGISLKYDSNKLSLEYEQKRSDKFRTKYHVIFDCN